MHGALALWGSPGFSSALSREIAALDISVLPLHRGMRYGSVPLAGSVEAMIHGYSEYGDVIHVRTGIFFRSIIAGCACADDPTPETENNEYCELELRIDKSTAELTATLLS